MELYNLIVETTRRCNMRCEHCLRGDPQNKAMPIEHLRSFLRQINYISSVTFTGGEPTLPSGLKVICDFMDVCNEFGIPVSGFYFVTNAKVWRKGIASVVARLYNFCDDNEISGIDISTDRYHDHIPERRRQFKYLLEEELMWHGIYNIVHQREDIEWDNVISEGRGVEFGSGRYNDPQDIYLEYWDDNDEPRISEGDIYINCDGNIINGCDWSYESQKEPANIICSVKDDFEKAVKKIAIQHETA